MTPHTFNDDVVIIFISMKGILEKDVRYRAILSVIHDRKSG